MDFLLDHALTNVWCSPDQDKQHVFIPARLSSSRGEIVSYRVMMRVLSMPNKTDVFHIFQIGHLFPKLIGLLQLNNCLQDEWIPITNILNELNIVVMMYNDLGVEVPKKDIWYRYTKESNLILAVRQNNKVNIDYGNENLYFRVYSNAYFRKRNTDKINEFIKHHYVVVNNLMDISNMQQTIESYKTYTGHTFITINGVLHDSLTMLNAKLGDTIEVFHDTSIKRIVMFKIQDLDMFESDVDKIRKFLLTYDVPNSEVQRIEYYDDTEMYLFNETMKKAHYLHKTAKTMKMVSHRDYSVSVESVYRTANGIKETTVNDCYIKLYIRDAGYDRPLVFENNRLHELYKLPYVRRKEAMLSIKSLDRWNVKNLEACDYIKLMQSNPLDLTRARIENAYGYNAISKLLGDTPNKVKIEQERKYIDVPRGLMTRSTAYEYDENGLLLEYHNHEAGTRYYCQNKDTMLVEMISGLGTHKPDVIFGIDNIPLPTHYNYRVYYSHTEDGISIEDWKDITGTDYYVVENNTLKWNNKDSYQLIMVRIDSAFLTYELSLKSHDQVFYFTLSEIENRDGKDDHYRLPVMLGELDIFLNRRLLLEGLDYHVDEKTKMVIITNKRYIVGDPLLTEQRVTVRFTGFSNKDGTRDYHEDFGFIDYGVMSHNNVFNIRDDRVLKIVYDGRLMTREDVIFSEEDGTARMFDSKNGKPYQIRDIVVPLRNLSDKDTYTFRDQSKKIDKEVSDYLSLYLPEPKKEGISVIEERHLLYSPFIAKIIADLATDDFPIDLSKVTLSDNDIKKVLEEYEYWLQYDPIKNDEIDKRYIHIHPHNHYGAVSLDLFKYRFIKRVIDLYAVGKVELSPFVSLKPTNVQ